MLKPLAQVRGREPTGAACPSYNLAREAAALSLVTRIANRRCVDPVGESAYFGAPLVPCRPSSLHVINTNAAGIDVHADLHMVCVRVQPLLSTTDSEAVVQLHHQPPNKGSTSSLRAACMSA